MNITSKGKYAVRVMADIARNGNVFVSLNDIASRQGISIKYLEKIISMLSKHGLVVSMRGSCGGYKLNKDAKDCTIKEILDATGNSSELASCLEQNCPYKANCDTIEVWSTLDKLINEYLSSVTLEDVIKKSAN